MRASKPTNDWWSIAQFLHLPDGVIHPEYPVQASTTNTSEHSAACFVHRLWLIWNQGLAIIPKLTTKGQSTWTASTTRLCFLILVEVPSPLERSALDFLTRGCLKSKIIWKHFERHSEDSRLYTNVFGWWKSLK